MGKVPPTRYFIKSFTDLLHGKLTAREVLIYGIVAEFEANETPCFISRAELAKRINESEATAERSLQLLISEGYIKATRNGRKRHLSTGYSQKPNLCQVDTSGKHDLYQIDTGIVSKQGIDLYQVDTLTRSINQINLTRSNNQIKDIKYTYKLVWDEDKQAMIRKRVAC